MVASERDARYDSRRSVPRMKRKIHATQARVNSERLEISRVICVSDFGDELKALRTRAGLDQKDVPAALERAGIDVGERTYQGWEKGENEPRSVGKKSAVLRALRKLADAAESGSVEEEAILTNAAIIFRHAESNEIWATAEFLFRVRVHKPMEIIGGEAGSRRVIEGDTE